MIHSSDMKIKLIHPLSEFGNLRQGQKSSVLECLNFDGQPQVPEKFDCKIIDAAAVVHYLPTNGVTTFEDYAVNTFVSYIHSKLRVADRVDVVSDRYLDDSLKNSTREHSGARVRMKVSAHAKLPAK